MRAILRGLPQPLRKSVSRVDAMAQGCIPTRAPLHNMGRARLHSVTCPGRAEAAPLAAARPLHVIAASVPSHWVQRQFDSGPGEL